MWKKEENNLTHFLLMFKCKMFLNSSPGSSRINRFLSSVSDNKPVSRTLWLYVNIIFFNEWSTAGMFSQHKEVDIDNRTQIGPRHHSLGFTFLFSLTGWLRAVSLFSFSGKNQKILNMKHQKCWHRVPKQQSNNFVAGAFIYTFPKPNIFVKN